MDRVKNIQLEELANFVYSQKSNKKIDCSCTRGKGIGCLATHFCRKKYKNRVTSAGYTNALVKKDQNKETFVFFKDKAGQFLYEIVQHKVLNYHQAQQILKKYIQPTN